MGTHFDPEWTPRADIMILSQVVTAYNKVFRKLLFIW
jgi:hypothetical protein